MLSLLQPLSLSPSAPALMPIILGMRCTRGAALAHPGALARQCGKKPVESALLFRRPGPGSLLLFRIRGSMRTLLQL